MKKRLLSALLTFCMVLTLLPVSALAVDSPAAGTASDPIVSTNNGVTIGKYLTGTGTEADPYMLTLEAYGSNMATTSSTTTPLEIVLVLDTSGSMDDSFGEDGYVYEKVDKTEWTYNDIQRSYTTYYYQPDPDGPYYRVTAEAEREWDWSEFEYVYSNYRIGYVTGGVWDQEFKQLGKPSDTDPDEILWTGTLYTRSYQSADTKLAAMKTAVNTFIDQVAESSTSHKIGIVSFASDVGTARDLTEVDPDGVTDLKRVVNGLWANGATNAAAGMSEAEDILDGSGNTGAKQVVVLFTDGEPTTQSSFSESVASRAVNTAKNMKDNGVEIYTVGIFDGADPGDITRNTNKYMNAVSSNYPSASVEERSYYGNKWYDWSGLNLSDLTPSTDDYYFAADDAAELKGVFEGIADSVTTGSLDDVEFTTDSEFTDVLSQYFNFPENFDSRGVTVKFAEASSYNTETQEFTFGELGDLPADSTADVIVSGKNISIKGFDYKAYAATYNETSQEVSGGKLVITFPIVLDTAACEANPTQDDFYPTNSNLSLNYTVKGQFGQTSTTDSPKVYYETSKAQSGHIHVNLMLDGEPLADGSAIESYLTIARTSDGQTSDEEFSFNEATDTINFQYEEYNSADVTFTAKGNYVIEGIDTQVVYGKDGYKGVKTNDNGSISVDNIKGCEDTIDDGKAHTSGVVTVYLRTAYSVEYYLNDGKLTDTPYNDSNTYVEEITEELVATVPTFGEGDKNVDDNGNQNGHSMTYAKSDLKTALTLPALPDEIAGEITTGWRNNLTDEFDVIFPGSECTIGSLVTDSDSWVDANNIIKFYAKTTNFTPTDPTPINGNVEKAPVTDPSVTLITPNGQSESLMQGSDYVKVTQNGNGSYVAQTSKDSATVLFQVTVTVTEAGTIEISDAGAEYLGLTTDPSDVYLQSSNGENAVVSFGASGTAVLYFSKTVSFAEGQNQITVENSVLVNGNEDNPVPSDPVDVTKAEDDIIVDKTVTITRNGVPVADTDPVQPGDVLEYTVTVTNNGDTNLKGVHVEDIFTGSTAPNNSDPATYWDKNEDGNYEASWTFDLDVGMTQKLTYTYTVQDADVGTTITNTATSNEGGNEGKTETPVDSYTLTYDANGGTGAPDPVTGIAANEKVTISDVTPTRDGYKFLGWAVLPDATEPFFLPGGTITMTGNATLYAVWQNIEGSIMKYPVVTDNLMGVTWVGGMEPSYTPVEYDGNGKYFVTADGSATEVTLLYGVQITLAEGSKTYTLTDNGATYVGHTTGMVVTQNDEGAVTFTVTAGTTATVYFSKTFVIADLTDNQAYNTAVVTPKDEDPIDVPSEPVEVGYSLTYDATTGYFVGASAVPVIRTQTETGLPVGEHALLYRGDDKPLHTNAYRTDEDGNNVGDPIPVVFIGWATSATFINEAAQEIDLNTHIFDAGEQFPNIVTEVAIPNTSTVYAVWGYDENGDGTADAQQIVIRPADITIYSGGTGYEGVVTDESGNTVGNTGNVEGNSNGLPEPGYYFTLPYRLNQALKEKVDPDGTGPVDLSQHVQLRYTATDENDHDRTWILELYNANSPENSTAYERYIYRMMPGNDGQDPVRLQIMGETIDDDYITSDEFEIRLDDTHKEYTMRLYTGSVDANQVKAVVYVNDPNNEADIIEGGDLESSGISLVEGNLVIRGATEDSTTSAVQDVNAIDVNNINSITAAAASDTIYNINGSQIPVNSGEIHLFTDSIVDEIVETESGTTTSSQLLEDTAKELSENILTDNHTFEHKYLDLVDASNGNAYVTPEKAVTIYWPLDTLDVPAGKEIDTSKPIYIVHYDGLDREFDDLGTALNGVKLTVYYYLPEGSTVDIPRNTERIQYVEMTEDNGSLVFQTSSFSPFAVVYEAEEPVVQYTITATAGPNGSISPSGNVTVNAGGSRTFTFNANSGYHIDTVTVDGRVISVSGSSYTFSNVQADHTIHVTFAENSDGGETTDYDYYVYYYRNYGATSARNEGYDSGERVTIRDNDWWDRDGYVFEGWNTEPDGSGRDYEPGYEFNIRSDLRLYAQWSRSSDGDGGDGPQLNKDEHIAYVSGTPEGLVKPEDFITREEVATIFFRLLTDESRAEYITEYNPYPDLSPDRWSYYSITTMTNGELMLGRPGGVFEPSAYITRGEFAVVAAQFSNAQYSGPDLFSDISDHWARDYINRAANEGWIAGYPDGSFGPDDYITRAQVMALVNEVLDRAPDADYMLDDMIVWPDNPEGAWYYEDVQEATNSHSYEWRNTQHTSEEWEDFIPMKPFNELVREAFNASR